ncbi:hypothetical protein AB4Z09_28615 [Rhodococcus sp. TAF43]|uniref:LolA family protein n=1 Tax=Rhodococcus sp. TAF43 TaxID=3237483 RepID=UPI003F988D22
MAERAPSWIELMGRHAASSSLFISAVLRYESRPDDSDTAQAGEFTLRYGPGERWRIDRAGHTVYVRNPRTTFLREGEEMRRLPGSFHLLDLGPVSPLDIVGPDTLLHNLSRRLVPTRTATSVVIDGRRGWELTLVPDTGDPGRLTVVIDDATGLLMRLDSTENELATTLTDVEVHDTLPASTFTWDGLIAAVPPDPADPLTTLGQRREVISAVASALEHREQVFHALADSADTDAARAELMNLLDVTTTGADAILAIQLRRLSRQERTRILRERDDLVAEYRRLSSGS